jgi:hypothetical protein
MPWANPIVGQLAGLRFRAGATSQAHALLEKLGPARLRSAGRAGRLSRHVRDFDRAAEWTERAIAERYPPLVAILGRSSNPLPMARAGEADEPARMNQLAVLRDENAQ